MDNVTVNITETPDNITVDTTEIPDNITVNIGEAGSIAWGSITGTLSNQTDLQNALDLKADKLISITGAGLLAGQGGDLSANRIFVLDNIDINHNQLLNYISDEHVDHSSVSISGAGLLSGQGGNITASRTFTLNNIDIDHNQLTNFHNLTSDINHDTILNNHNLTTDIDHDQLFNFNLDEHIDHTSIDIIAGTALTGGGTIDVSRTLNVDYTVLDARYLQNIVNDITPQLGGDLDGQSTYDIINMVDGTFSGTLQAEHLYTTDDLQVNDDIFLGDGSILDWDNGDVTLTHSSGILNLDGDFDAEEITVTKLLLRENGSATGTANTYLQERTSSAVRRIMLYGEAQSNKFGFIVAPTDITAKDVIFALWGGDHDNPSTYPEQRYAGFQIKAYSTNGDLDIFTRAYPGYTAGDITLSPNRVETIRIELDGGVEMPRLKNGATQVAAGASADELWITNGHATLPDNVIMIGV